MGYDKDSTHAHCIYWAGTHKISVERNIRFIPDSVAIPIPIPHPAQSARLLIQAMPQPPAATDSGEEEVEVEDELIDLTPAPAVAALHGNAGQHGTQAVQPTCQSTRTQKPLALMRRLAAGEGTIDVDLSAYVAAAPLTPTSADAEPEETYLVGFEDIALSMLYEVEGDPKTVHQAQSCSDWPCWKEVMDREMEALERAGTWTTVKRKLNTNVVSCKWVFKLKRQANGFIDKYKARLVA